MFYENCENLRTGPFRHTYRGIYPLSQFIWKEKTKLGFVFSVSNYPDLNTLLYLFLLNFKFLNFDSKSFQYNNGKRPKYKIFKFE